MKERTYERVGALTGIVFVLLELLSGFLYPQQPRIDSSPATTLAWVHDHRVALQVGMICGMVGAAVLLWFVGYLRHVVSRAEGGAEMLSPIVLGSGVAVAALLAITTLPVALLAFMDGQTGGVPDATVVRLLADLNIVAFGALSAVTAVFVLVLGLATWYRQLAARWLGWVCAVVVVCNAVSIWIGVTFNSYHGKGWNPVAFGAFLGFALVVLVISIYGLLGRPSRPAA
jgi:hypothetical protein